jgi:hypothetical protein
MVVARRGESHKRVGKISVQVLPPGSHVRRPGSPPVFRCTPPVSQTGIPGAGLFVSPPGENQGADPQSRSHPLPDSEPAPGHSGVLAEPPFHIGTGNGGVDMLLALLLYGTLGLGGAVLMVYLVRFFRSSSSL